MKNSEDLRFALNFLANWQLKTPQTRQTVQEELQRMSNGSPEQQSAAKELLALISYPGSDKAMNMAFLLGNAIATNQGAKAVGLPTRVRGKSYNVKYVKRTDRIKQVMVDHALGVATAEEVKSAALGYLGLKYDDRTIRKFIKDLEPDAIAEAKGIRWIFQGWRAEKIRRAE